MKLKWISLILIPIFIVSALLLTNNQPHPYHDKVAQMIMVGFNGQTLKPQNPIYKDIATRHIGGVILFAKDASGQQYQKNIKTKEQVKKLITDLQALSPTPLFVAIDQEGGLVSRLPASFGVSALSAWTLGQKNDLMLTRAEADKTASVLKDLGFNVNFAPCVDVALNPDSPIIMGKERSFSADPERVATHAEQVIKAFHAAGILPVLKHFPGHGSAKGDTHAGFVDITSDYRESELLPYQRLVPKQAPLGVMVAHVFHHGIDTDWPLSLSGKNIQGNLRQKLNFNGIVFSDDLQMRALTAHHTWEDIVVQAVNAGNDVLVIGNNLNYEPDIARRTIDIILRALDDGRISPARIDEAYDRIMTAKQ